MNLELLDPWEQEYPQIIQDTLEDGYVLNCRFNRRGTLLAGGCHDGRCVVWDFDTKGMSRNLIGHIRPVVSLSWSHHGGYLLSASKDWSCILWDLVAGKRICKVRFETPPLMAHMHPRNNFLFVVALVQSDPVLVEVVDGKPQRRTIQLDGDTDDQKSQAYVTAIAWNKTGTRLYCGTSKGQILVLDTDYKIVHTMRVTTSTIKDIQFSRNGRHLLVNANDRVIRCYNLDTPESEPVLQNKFQDLVNRIQWNQACFSADGEFVIGGSGHKAEHNIYIWDKNIGNLVKILEGPKEPLDDLAWHPLRPIIASVSSFGNIYVWTTKHEENWSAFAPDFTELEENLEYEEKEDEFDVVPEEEVSKRKQDDEDIEVDVTTCEEVQAFMDPDEDKNGINEEEVLYLPSLPLQSDENDSEDDMIQKWMAKHSKRSATDETHQPIKKRQLSGESTPAVNTNEDNI